MNTDKLHKYEGILELYFETGMECMGTIFHDNRGLHEGVDYADHSKKRMYHSLAWSIWFGNKICVYQIKIFDHDGNVVYEGPLTKDKYKMAAEKYRYAYLPKEIDTATWLEYCTKEYKAELSTNELPSALKEEYKMTFDVGEIVLDDLTGKDVVVTHATVDTQANVGYWVNDKYLDGGRLPSEISKIDWRDRLRKEIAAEESSAIKKAKAAKKVKR